MKNPGTFSAAIVRWLQKLSCGINLGAEIVGGFFSVLDEMVFQHPLRNRRK
jgi:hypothetical protein